MQPRRQPDDLRIAFNSDIGIYVGLAIYIVAGFGLAGGWAGDAWPIVLIFLLAQSAVNVLFIAVLSRLWSGAEWLRYVFVLANLAFVAAIVVSTGGHSSPFWVLLLVDAVVTALYTGLPGIAFSLLGSSLVLLGSAYLEGASLETYSLVGIQVTVIFFVSLLTERSMSMVMSERAEAHSQSVLHTYALAAQEAERRRLSVEVHDGPLQSLGVALLVVDRAHKRYERGENEMVLTELENLRAHLVETVNEVRSILSDLGQELLHEYGLEVALKNYIERFSILSGIATTLEGEAGRRFPADVEVIMYRLAQEALANVRKHSGATSATVSLSLEGQVLHLSVTDNGRGFDVEEALRRYEEGMHLGLRSMRQRVHSIGGNLRIDSHPGKGAALHFSCPVPPIPGAS